VTGAQRGDFDRPVTAPVPVDRTGADDATALSARAGRRYWHDAEFSGRVKEVVQIAERGQPDDGFDRFHKDSLIMGAALALDLADQLAALKPAPGTPPAARTGEDDGAEVARLRAELAKRTASLEMSLEISRHRAAERDDLIQRVAALPARPLVSGTANRDNVARWFAAREVAGGWDRTLGWSEGAEMRASWLADADELLALLTPEPAPGTGSGQAVQRVLDAWEDNRSRGFDCEPCRGTGRVPLLGMPDGSEAATTCLDCDGTGRAAVAGPQRRHDEEGVWQHFRYIEPHEAVPVPGTEVRRWKRDVAACANCNNGEAIQRPRDQDGECGGVNGFHAHDCERAR